MKVLVPFGTRPEIVKLAPVVRQLVHRGVEVRTVATGQHRDRNLTEVFYEALGLEPDAIWAVDGDEGERVGQILTLAFQEIAERLPDLVLLLGDTYTVPLFSLAARRHAVPVVHLEAGLRSFNETSMEEVNRRVAAATASLHLAPTELAASFLRTEGVPDERIEVVGNPAIDALRLLGVDRCPLERRAGVLLTAHRPTNVDDPGRLGIMVDLIAALGRELGPVSFPVHPRTRARLRDAGLLPPLERDPAVRLLDPVPYREMIELMAASKVVVTDSGGLQEEASWLGVPVVVLRASTPRWEGMYAGTSVLTGVDLGRAMDAARRLCRADEQARVAAASCPYGDGHTAERVADLLMDSGTAELLRLREPEQLPSSIATTSVLP